MHTVCSSGYWMLLADLLGIKDRWVLLLGAILVQYIASVSSSTVFSWALCLISISGFFIRVKKNQIKISSESISIPTELIPTKIEGNEIVNSLRFMVCSLVGISIFACDFLVYPTENLKSKEFGISLMDFGVVCFMLNAGMIFSVARHRFRIKKIVYLLLLGVARLLVLKSGYYSDPTEYGIHMNFYFVYVAAEALSVLFSSFPSAAVAVTLFFAHEMIIFRGGVIEYILYAPRKDFISANREGIISIVPYTAVLFFGKYIGEIVMSKKKTTKEKGREFGWIFSFLICVHLISLLFIRPSRRLCSLSFTSFACAVITFANFMYYTIGSMGRMPKMCPAEEISRLMGPLFLLSNLYVLIGNLFFDWKKISNITAHFVNLAYLFLLFVLPVMVYRRVYTPQKKVSAVRPSKYV